MNDYEPNLNSPSDPQQDQSLKDADMKIDAAQSVSSTGSYTAPAKGGATFRSANDAKYKNARINLLLVTILSAVNVFSLFFARIYFLFSAYLPQLITEVGIVLYEETNLLPFAIVAAVIALIMIVPYLLAWIFSKKNVGWMIAAAILYGLDTLFFLSDFAQLLIMGEVSGIFDLIFHGWVIFSLISAVVYGIRAKKESEAAPVQANGEYNATAEIGAEEFATTETRTLTVTREKKFAGSAVQFICFANGRELFRLKNGETKAAEVPVSDFELGFMLTNELASEKITVPAGDAPIAYSVLMQVGFSSGKFVIQEKTV